MKVFPGKAEPGWKRHGENIVMTRQMKDASIHTESIAQSILVSTADGILRRRDGGCMKRKKNDYEIMWACPKEVCPNAGDCENCEEKEDAEHKADNTQSGERVCSAES